MFVGDFRLYARRTHLTRLYVVQVDHMVAHIDQLLLAIWVVNQHLLVGFGNSRRGRIFLLNDIPVTLVYNMLDTEDSLTMFYRWHR